VFITLFLLAMVIIYQSVTVLSLLKFGQPGSGLLPFLLGLALAVLSLVLLFNNKADSTKDDVFLLPTSALRLLIVIALLIMSGLVFQWLGAPVTVGLLVALWLILLERKQVWVGLTTGGLTAIGIWLVFCVAFKAELPLGFWVK